MITLYELYWSHYCEKVRWALNHIRVPWTSVRINAFSKKEMQRFPANSKGMRTVPMIHDGTTGRVVYESTAILRYLDQTYPDGPRLFPRDPRVADLVCARLLEFDTVLAIPARRFGYTQLMLECPTALARLFLENTCRGIFTRPVINRASSVLVAMILIKRFDMHRSEELRLYEKLEAYLLELSSSLSGRQYLFDEFTAADIGLACQLRPLRIVPFFAEHPGLACLFKWQETILQRHGQEMKFAYEELIDQARRERPPVRRYLRDGLDVSAAQLFALFPADGASVTNDHQPIWSLDLLKAPYWYFRKIWHRKVRRLTASATVR